MIKKLNTLQKQTLLRDYILLLNSMGYEVRELIGKPLNHFNFEYIYSIINYYNEEFYSNEKCYYFSYAPIYQNCFEKKLNNNENE